MITAKILAKNTLVVEISSVEIMLIQHFSGNLKRQQSNFDI